MGRGEAMQPKGPLLDGMPCRAVGHRVKWRVACWSRSRCVEVMWDVGAP